MEVPLCRLWWFKGIYKKIYAVLSAEGMLPDPCSMPAAPASSLEAQGKTASGAARGKEKKLRLKEQPPDPAAFAHELLHLIDASEKTPELEELCSSLAGLAVLLAEKDITPRVNITRLLSAGEEDILKALRKVCGAGFEKLEDFFEFIGVVPLFAEVKEDAGGRAKIVRSGKCSGKTAAVLAAAELAAGAEYDPLLLEVLLELLSAAEKHGS